MNHPYQQIETPDPEPWRCRAACRDVAPETMFPIAGRGQGKRGAEAVALAVLDAKAVCKRCPVTSECLTFALEYDQRHGIWGGLTEDERRALRRSVPRQRKEPTHGTVAGYKQHRRLGQQACEACLQANRRRSS